MFVGSLVGRVLENLFLGVLYKGWDTTEMSHLNFIYSLLIKKFGFFRSLNILLILI